MYAFTEGHSPSAVEHALAKKLMQPKLTPWLSLNLSLYCFLTSITRVMSTSLKVVSMAVVFLDSTSRRLMVLRSALIFS